MWNTLLMTTKTGINIFLRTIAVFGVQALSVIGGGALIMPNVPIWNTAALAGVAAVCQVLTRLSQSFLEDGILTEAEINAAFQVKTPSKGDNN